MADLREVFILIPGKPVPKGRPRATKIGGFIRMYTPPTTQIYETLCADEAKACMQGHKPFEGPVEVNMQIFVPIPKSYNKARKEACRLGKIVPTGSSDLDNVFKSVMDGFNGIVFVDDSQIVDAHVTKRFSDEPCVIAIVTPLDLESS